VGERGKRRGHCRRESWQASGLEPRQEFSKTKRGLLAEKKEKWHRVKEALLRSTGGEKKGVNIKKGKIEKGTMRHESNLDAHLMIEEVGASSIKGIRRGQGKIFTQGGRAKEIVLIGFHARKGGGSRWQEHPTA